MLRKTLLPTIFALLAYGFWVSPDLKEIAAGVSIFLFGMLSLEEGFRGFTGGVLEAILRRTTDRNWKSLTVGIVATTIMQSSSLISVITISFLSAGLIELAAGIGIIFGANLGTTTGAWLVAGFGLKVDIAAFAMPMLVFGVALIFQRAKALKGIGHILAGLGFLFLGIAFMKDGFEAFRATFDLSRFGVPGVVGLLLFTLIGALATVVMQSSHATLVLIITALAAMQITYENALALAVGANVGTTITAIIGSMGANERGKRLAGAHLVFNVVTAAVAIVLIRQFMFAVDWVSAWVGIPADDFTLKLAVFHTLFNLTGIVLMFPFIGRLVVVLDRVIKAKEPAAVGAKYLNTASIDFPDTAVEAIRNETLHMYENARDILTQGISLEPEDIVADAPLERLIESRARVTEMDIDDEYEKRIKALYGAIVEFVSRAPFSWEMHQSGSVHWLRSANRGIVEAVKDMKHLRKNLALRMTSQHAEVRAEYNAIRLLIASVLRELEHYRTAPPEETSAVTFDALFLTIQDADRERNRRVAELIRDGKISPDVGTSLLNDSGYATELSHKLVEAARTLFVIQGRDVEPGEREIVLSDVELEEVRIADAAGVWVEDPGD